jgi:hypothetical protein
LTQFAPAGLLGFRHEIRSNCTDRICCAPVEPPLDPRPFDLPPQ